MTDKPQELYEIERVIRSVLTPNSYIVPQEGIELTKAILDWHNKQVIQELREAKRSSDAGWYATYRVAELEKESKQDE